MGRCLGSHFQKRITAALRDRESCFDSCVDWLRFLEDKGHTHVMMADECANLGVVVSEYTIAKWLQSDRKSRQSESVTSAAA